MAVITAIKWLIMRNQKRAALSQKRTLHNLLAWVLNYAHVVFVILLEGYCPS